MRAELSSQSYQGYPPSPPPPPPPLLVVVCCLGFRLSPILPYSPHFRRALENLLTDVNSDSARLALWACQQEQVSRETAVFL
jgi:hypothetical protein